MGAGECPVGCIHTGERMLCTHRGERVDCGACGQRAQFTAENARFSRPVRLARGPCTTGPLPSATGYVASR